MPRILFFFFWMTCLVSAKAQKNYAQALQQGDTAFYNGQYQTAINKYFAAEAFDPSKKDVVKARVNRTFYAIESLRNKAEVDKTSAEEANKSANKQKKITEDALADTRRQTLKAIKEKQKSQELNKFMQYNNGQVFDVIAAYDSLLLDLKIREYNLSIKYDLAVDDSYKFNSFCTLSKYYSNNKKFAEALSWADSLCRYYPDSAMSFEQRSVVNYYRADWQQALNDLDTALQLNRISYEVPLLTWNKALVLSNLSRYKESNNYINETVALLQQKYFIEVWCDYVPSGDIDSITNIKSIYLELNEQIEAMKIYATINDIYAGFAPVRNLENMAAENIAISILLAVINYTSTHLLAQPSDYVGYLVNGFFWELANEPKLAEKNYRIFLKACQKTPTKKYNQYKNNFSSPVYNNLKK